MAFATLLSLAHVLEQTLHQDYQFLAPTKQNIASLLKKTTSLQDFLENSSRPNSETTETLQSQIIDAALEAEDIIESYISKRLLFKYASHKNDRIFRRDLQKVIEKIDSIRQMTKIEQPRTSMPAKTGLRDCTTADLHDDSEKIMDRPASSSSNLEIVSIDSIKRTTKTEQPRTSMPADSSKVVLTACRVVGLDNDVKKILDRLTSNSPKLETVSVVGMGGIGKTTLAKTVYKNKLIEEYFYVRAMVTVSLDFDLQKILRELLHSINDSLARIKDNMDLKDRLYQSLKGKKYLIVMDDVWDINILEELKPVFPNDNNGSRIMLTTRLEKVACYKNHCPPHYVHLLDEDQSWKLFCESAFGKSCCPPELEKIGKEITRYCRGLPLSIIVIGGHLSKASKTQHDWSNVADNLNSTVTSIDERCSNVLYLTYNNLPHHLKGCFLYMGIFPEDYNIKASKLVKLWIAEGIVKPMRSKSLEDVAEEYLLNIAERSLVINCKKKFDGKIKRFMIHDLIRGLCVNEAKRWNFYHVSRNMYHCAKRPSGTPYSPRSIIRFRRQNDTGGKFVNLLRVLHAGEVSINAIAQMVNLRCLSANFSGTKYGMAVESMLKNFQNLQTIILQRIELRPFSSMSNPVRLPQEIWKMHQLRHVKVGAAILPSPVEENSSIVLENLQTLSGLMNFRCTEAILKRIPNLKKLEISYEGESASDWGYYLLNNLACLCKLQALKVNLNNRRPHTSFLQKLTFPTSLKKLTLIDGEHPWEDMTIVGSLPNLQVLKLKFNAFSGPVWEPTEGQFPQLKVLALKHINLKYWRAENIHFPMLQHLQLVFCDELNEIPSGIGEIPSLESISLSFCSESVKTSAERIKEEQKEWDNDGLSIIIKKGSIYEKTVKHLLRGI